MVEIFHKDIGAASLELNIFGSNSTSDAILGPIITLGVRWVDLLISPGLLDNNPEQIRNKLKISAYVLETT